MKSVKEVHDCKWRQYCWFMNDLLRADMEHSEPRIVVLKSKMDLRIKLAEEFAKEKEA